MFYYYCIFKEEIENDTSIFVSRTLIIMASNAVKHFYIYYIYKELSKELE